MDTLEEFSVETTTQTSQVVVASCPMATEWTASVVAAQTVPLESVATVENLSRRLQRFPLFKRIFFWIMGIVCFRKSLAIVGMFRGYDVEFHTKLSAYGMEYSGEVKITKAKL